MVHKYSYIKSESKTTIYFDALETFSRDFSAATPEYPTEAGNKVSDAVLKSLPQVSASGLISANSLTIYGAQNQSQLEKVIDNLIGIYTRAELCKLYVGLTVVDNLIISSLSIRRSSSTGYAYEVDITFKKMIFPVATVAKFYLPETNTYSGETKSYKDVEKLPLPRGGGGGNRNETR